MTREEQDRLRDMLLNSADGRSGLYTSHNYYRAVYFHQNLAAAVRGPVYFLLYAADHAPTNCGRYETFRSVDECVAFATLHQFSEFLSKANNRG